MSRLSVNAHVSGLLRLQAHLPLLDVLHPHWSAAAAVALGRLVKPCAGSAHILPTGRRGEHRCDGRLCETGCIHMCFYELWWEAVRGCCVRMRDVSVCAPLTCAVAATAQPAGSSIAVAAMCACAGGGGVVILAAGAFEAVQQAHQHCRRPATHQHSVPLSFGAHKMKGALLLSLLMCEHRGCMVYKMHAMLAYL